jgi:hypothetical protein
LVYMPRNGAGAMDVGRSDVGHIGITPTDSPELQRKKGRFNPDMIGGRKL